MIQSELLRILLESRDRGEPVARVVIVDGEGQGLWALVREADAPGWESLAAAAPVLAAARAALLRRRHSTIEHEGRTYWVEVLGAPPTLLIVGAGHIAQPLAELGKLAGFRVVIMDDRPRYANRERFPNVDEVIAEPLTSALARYPLDPDSYLVLVTRGHAHDVECLVEVIDRPHAYVGMVGSKRRVQAVWKLLEEEKGILREQLGRVYAPIGLDIGAETPEEIAIAIMAEIILIRRGGTGEPLSDALRARGARVHLGRVKGGTQDKARNKSEP